MAQKFYAFAASRAHAIDTVTRAGFSPDSFDENSFAADSAFVHVQKIEGEKHFARSSAFPYGVVIERKRERYDPMHPVSKLIRAIPQSKVFDLTPI